MSNFKKLLGGLINPQTQMTRRNFLGGVGAAAGSAALPKVPGAGNSVETIRNVLPFLRDPKALDYFKKSLASIQATGAGSVSVEFPDEYGLLSREQLQELLEQARVANSFAKIRNPRAGAEWNPITRQFHELGPEEGTGEARGYRYLEGGQQAPHALTDEEYMSTLTGFPEDRKRAFAEARKNMAPTLDEESYAWLQQDDVDKGELEGIKSAWADWKREVYNYQKSRGEVDKKAYEEDRMAREMQVADGMRLGSNRNELSPQDLQSDPYDFSGFEQGLLEPRGRASARPTPTRSDAIRRLRDGIPAVLATGGALSGLGGGEK